MSGVFNQGRSVVASLVENFKWICSMLESLLSNEVKCGSSSLPISMSNKKFKFPFKTFSARKC